MTQATVVIFQNFLDFFRAQQSLMLYLHFNITVSAALPLQVPIITCQWLKRPYSSVLAGTVEGQREATVTSSLPSALQVALCIHVWKGVPSSSEL